MKINMLFQSEDNKICHNTHEFIYFPINFKTLIYINLRQLYKLHIYLELPFWWVNFLY